MASPPEQAKEKPGNRYVHTPGSHCGWYRESTASPSLGLYLLCSYQDGGKRTKPNPPHTPHSSYAHSCRTIIHQAELLVKSEVPSVDWFPQDEILNKLPAKTRKVNPLMPMMTEIYWLPTIRKLCTENLSGMKLLNFPQQPTFSNEETEAGEHTEHSRAN